MAVAFILQLLKLCIITFTISVAGFSEYGIPPFSANFHAIPPTEGTIGPVHLSNVPISAPESEGSGLHAPPASPPLNSAPVPEMVNGLLPFFPPSIPGESPQLSLASPPIITTEGRLPSLAPATQVAPSPVHTVPPPFSVQGDAPSISPTASREKASVNRTSWNSPLSTPAIHPSIPNASHAHSDPRNAPNKAPSTEAVAPVPSEAPMNSLKNSSAIQPKIPSIAPYASPSNSSNNTSPKPFLSAPVASPPRELEQAPSEVQPIVPRLAPFLLPNPTTSPTRSPQISPAIHPIVHWESPSTLAGCPLSPITNSPPGINRKRDRIPAAVPSNETPMPLPPVTHSPKQGSSAIAPSHKIKSHSNDAPVPSLSAPESPPNGGDHSPAVSPYSSFHKHPLARNIITSPAPASYLISPSPSGLQGPIIPPSHLPMVRRERYAPSPLIRGSSVSLSPLNLPVPSSVTNASSASSPAPTAASGQTHMPLISPTVSPSGSPSRRPKAPALPPIRTLPPPPPNEDCSTTICTEPYTNTPPGSPCGCVWPMQVGLRLSVALYTFFPLVSELAEEIAAGVFMKQSQVRIMGANAASEQLDKTIILIDLVPLGEKFDNTTGFLTFQRFWHKQVPIKDSFFGDYEVLYVHYPGLPPSPPSAPSNITILDGGPYSGHDNNGRTIKPLGVDVQKKRRNNDLSSGMIAVVVLSGSVALLLCSAVAWVLLVKNRDRPCQPVPTQQPMLLSLAKPSGSGGSAIGSGLTSASLSFGSSIAPYTGSAKTFSAIDIERATDNFDTTRILGEGGFGRVYSGLLEDGTKVAVKVLKRDDQQGGREFLAEVEMLSRLHHRNLVKLIGICTEERFRCLVYELIPNGSVESHLHGINKESTPLDWDARIKIALGAARGLAYLHEDSSPRVIHRDFKSSNILLEQDFTPKVSDFGLARTAMDEESRHISTRVMGTFGYVAPEYAMTGHLLVKSDVYSYGVVLLELLTGRKPVDMSQPPGQENLVAWARPLLTSKEGLESIVDPSLGANVPFDSVAKVAAIASMCVQPEVSNRPFMGEVVQALKLVCNECDEAKEMDSRRSSHDDLSIDMCARVSVGSGQLPDPSQDHYAVANNDSEPDIEIGLSASDLFNASAGFERQVSGSFRRHSSSGPLRTGRSQQFWQTIRRFSGGSVSDHGVMLKPRSGSR